MKVYSPGCTEHCQVGHHRVVPMIGVQPSIQMKESHSLKMWIILEVGAHILSDQCLNQEVENTSVMPCLLALFLFLLMLKWGREKKVDMSSSTKDGSKTIQLKENCRFGATREELFPTATDRDFKLDVTFLKKMGLSKQRMLECDALFF
jgi:hypothetical protein